MKKLLLMTLVLFAGLCAVNAQYTPTIRLNSVSLPSTITIAQGETIDLRLYVTKDPPNANRYTLSWSLSDDAKQYMTLSGYMLTGVKPNNTGAIVTGSVVTLTADNTLKATTRVIVTPPKPTSINIKSDHKEITVSLNDRSTLTNFLKEAYELTPSNSTWDITWAIANTSIVKMVREMTWGQTWSTYYSPIGVGTTTLTAQALDSDGNLIVQASQKVTVHVVVPLESIDYDGDDITCALNDDLSQTLASKLRFTPENATNKDYKWKLYSGSPLILSISEDGKTVKAVRTANYNAPSINAVSVENPKIASPPVKITICNPAVDLSIVKDVMEVKYPGTVTSYNGNIESNIKMLPEDYDRYEEIKVTSSNTQVLTQGTVTKSGKRAMLDGFNIAGPGESTVTVVLTYYDYLKKYNGYPESQWKKTVTKTFKFRVTSPTVPVESLTNTSGLDVVDCNIGDDLTAFLNSIVKVSPDNATDKTLSWSLSSGSSVTVSNGTIKAVKSGTSKLIVSSVDNPNAKLTITVRVHNPATSVKFTNQKVSVPFYGSVVDIGDLLKQNITFLPTGFDLVGEVNVTSSNSKVVKISKAQYGDNGMQLNATAEGVGTATITVTVKWYDYLKAYAGENEWHSTQKTFTVEVVKTAIPVESIVNTSGLDQVQCNVGDDLTSFLNSSIEVLPDNATDKSLSWSVVSGTAVAVRNGAIKAVRSGTAKLSVASVNNPNAKLQITVRVLNPATDFQLAKQKISIPFYGITADIGDLLKQNITLLPSSYEMVHWLSLSSNSANVEISSSGYNENGIYVTASALKAGTVTITVTLQWIDFLQGYIDESTAVKTVQKSFDVELVNSNVSVEKLLNTSNMDEVKCNIGDNLTSYLNSIIEVQPAHATDKTFSWNVESGNSVTVSDGAIKAVRSGVTVLRATSNSNPQATTTVRIRVVTPATDIKIAKSILQMDYLGSEIDITDLVRQNITFLPSGYDDVASLSITSDKPAVVNISDVAYTSNGLQLKATALGAGMATITVNLGWQNYLSDYTDPQNAPHIKIQKKTFIVNLTANVAQLYNDSSRDAEECNVGDDLTQHLNSLIRVLPESAPDKSFTWSVSQGSAVSVTNGTIKAVKAGTAVLKATSVANPQVTTTVNVLVHNPATDVRFTYSTLSVDFHGEANDVSRQLQDNITFLPAGYESIGHLAVTSNRPDDVVNVNVTSAPGAVPPQLTALALGEGKATVTVTFDYVDYLGMYADMPESQFRKTVTKSFTVDVVTTEIPVKTLTNISGLNQVDCNVGDDLTAYMNTIIKVLPENATDKTYTWSLSQGSAVTLSGGTIKAVKAGMAVLKATSVANPQATATVNVLVHNPATDLKIAKSILQMSYYGSEIDIREQLKQNISFLPAGFGEVSSLAITSDKPAVVNIADVSYTANGIQMTATALSAGMATITVTVGWHDYLADYADPQSAPHMKTASKVFIVNLTANVSKLTNTSSHQTEECNVGDDLTAYLNSIIKVSPDNAPDKSFTWSVSQGSAVTVTGGTIKAVKAGNAELTATSVANPQATATVSIRVHNPATAIQIAKSSIEMDYYGSDIDIREQLKQNISFLPAGFGEVGSLAITSDKPAVVSIADVSYTPNGLQLTATARGAGTATVTVTLGWRDYLADYTDPQNAPHTTTVKKTFTVKVKANVSALTNTSSRQTEECNVGDDLTKYLNSIIKATPENAVDKSFTWSVASGNAVTVSQGAVKAVRAGTAVLTATSVSNPKATATVNILVHNPATSIQLANQTVSVAYKGSPVDIGSQLKQNITFLPAGYESVGSLSVTSDKAGVVKITEASYNPQTGMQLRAQALSEGKATVTVTIGWSDYLSDYTDPQSAPHVKTATKTFTVDVITTEIPVTSVTNTSGLNQVECNVGDNLSAYLNTIIKVSPDNATDKTYTWSLTSGSAVTVSGTTIKAVRAGSAVLTATSVNNPQAKATVNILVHNPATDIQIAKSTIEMDYYGSEFDIRNQLKSNISLLPAGYAEVGSLSVTSDQSTVVNITDVHYADGAIQLVATACGAGTATVTVTVGWNDYLSDYTDPHGAPHKHTVSKTFTVNLKPNVASLTNISGLNQVECNVGDNLTSFLNSIIEVSPENAVDKTYTWSVASGEAVTVSGGTIQAVRAGTAVLKATSVANPQASATVSIVVHNPATGINLASQTVSVAYKGSTVDISSQLKQNISFLPAGYESFSYLSVTSDQLGVVNIDDAGHAEDGSLMLVAQALGEGKATITVTIGWRDYLSDYTDPQGAPHVNTVTKSFTVDVITTEIPVTAVTNISGLVQVESIVGDDLTPFLNSIIKVEPDNATDKTYTWSVASGDAVTVVGGVIQAVRAGTVVLKATSVSNPQASATVNIVVYNPATDIQLAGQSLSVAYKGSPVDISTQLKSNVSFLPVGYDELGGLTVTSDQPGVVKITEATYNPQTGLQLAAQALGEGTAAITVTIGWHDYLSDYTDPQGAPHLRTTTKTFTVNVVTTEIPVTAVTNTSGLNQVECNVGDDLTPFLNSIITVEPDNATDKTYTWSLAQGDAVTVAGGTILAVKPGTAVLKATSVSNPQASATVNIVVHNPATDIQLGTQSLSVSYKDSPVDISSQLKQNITFMPADFEGIGGLIVFSDQPGVVSVADVSYTPNGLQLTATALSAGTATVTVTIGWQNYLADYTDPAGAPHFKTATKTFTVKVVTNEVTVTSLTNTSGLDQVECSVGNDLTSFLNSIIKVSPDNATDKTFTWSVAQGDAVTVAGGTIKAVKSGAAVLKATSVANPQASTTVNIVVHHPATDIAFTQSSITVLYKGEPVRITNQIIDNITLLPEGYEDIESFTVTSSAENVVRIWDVGGAEEIHLMAEALSEGTATITVTLNYTDYLGQLTNPNGQNKKTVTKTFTVKVVGNEVAVTGITLGMTRFSCNKGDDITSYLNGLVKVVPAEATDKSYTWTVTEGSSVDIDSNGKVTAVKTGISTLTVTSVSNPQVSATVTVVVNNSASDIAIAQDVITIDYYGQPIEIGDKLLENITILPVGYGDIDSYTVTSSDPEVVNIIEAKTNSIKAQALSPGTAIITVSLIYYNYLEIFFKTGVGRYLIKKTFMVEVREFDPSLTDEAIVTFPATVTLSKLRDVALTLTHTNADKSRLDSAKVAVVIADGPHGWTVASVNGRGLRWTLRGMAVGEYDYYVTYDGKRMKTDSNADNGKLIIPAEIGFESGWDWISLFTPRSYALTDGNGDYLSSLSLNADNRIIEIRSRNAAIYNDPSSGLFGDITELKASDGMYKIKSVYQEKNAAAMTFNLGTGNGSATAAQLSAIDLGYNWICYPHEQAHTVATLNSYLSDGPVEGDVIIGHDAFLEFNGYKWIGSLEVFEPGKGFIYYRSAEGSFRLNWGDYYLPQEDVTVSASRSVWNYCSGAYMNSMPIVATLSGVADQSCYSIGAFVGDECRGHGDIVDGEHFFITVNGKPGEQIRFMLYDAATGTYRNVSGTMTFAMGAGSLRKPVIIDAVLSSLQVTSATTFTLAYQRPDVVVNGAGLQLTVSVQNLAGETLLTSHSAVTSLQALPAGIYIVTASDGRDQKTIKITK